MRKLLLYIITLVCCIDCNAQNSNAYIQVLGVAQDGGYPHMGCTRQCCNMAWQHPEMRRYVVSLALVDSTHNKWWLIEATPDIREQLQYFKTLTNSRYKYLPEGIIITHAHIGHYTGLMELGREVMGTKNVPVYVLPKMKKFLEENGPWSQLVKLNNISLQMLQPDADMLLSEGISLKAMPVPHRDEYSETAGYKITAGKKTYLFIPDVDKWGKWNRNIIDEVKQADVALLDATFYDNTELPGRSIEEVPHPLVTETMQLFSTADATKQHLYFIHINHTNPLLWDKNKQQAVVNKGFHIAQQGQIL